MEDAPITTEKNDQLLLIELVVQFFWKISRVYTENTLYIYD